MCVLLVAGIVGAILVVRKRRVERDARTADAMPRDPFADVDSDMLRGDPRALKAGDIFDTHGETLTVRGSLRLKEGGYQWSEHLIDTGGGVKRWLSVEEDPDLELFLWTAVSGRDVPAPGPEYLDYQGKRFRSKESGQARYRSEATTGLAGDGRMTYHDYVAEDGSRLSFEDFDAGGRSEVAIGLRIHRNEITIYPQQP
ncbi:MAG: DUF4178 domain-containing protein [Stackebrandtia sp.]